MKIGLTISIEGITTEKLIQILLKIYFDATPRLGDVIMSPIPMIPFIMSPIPMIPFIFPPKIYDDLCNHFKYEFHHL